MILSKTMKSHEGKTIISLCDKDIKGRVFEEEGIVLDLTSEFYGNENEFDIKKANSINAVGEESVKFLIDKGLITPGDAKKVSGVPYIIIALK